MTLGAPLLSITRNADEWLEYSNDNVTLLLSLSKNVFNGDTECYCAAQMPFAVPLLRSTCVVVGLLSLVASLRRKDTWFTLSLFATAMYGPFASQPTKNDPAPSTTVNRDTECYCGVRYFQSLQFIEPYRARRAIVPPNEKASCAA